MPRPAESRECRYDVAVSTTNLAFVDLCAEQFDAAPPAYHLTYAVQFLATDMIEFEHSDVGDSAIDAAVRHCREHDLPHPRSTSFTGFPDVGEVPLEIAPVVLFLAFATIRVKAVFVLARLVELRIGFLDLATNASLHGFGV